MINILYELIDETHVPSVNVECKKLIDSFFHTRETYAYNLFTQSLPGDTTSFRHFTKTIYRPYINKRYLTNSVHDGKMKTKRVSVDNVFFEMS